MRLSADVTISGGTVTLRCKGQILYGDEVDRIAEEVRKTNPASHRVIVDLSGVEELRSGDLGMLWLKYMEALGHGWRIAFVNLPAHIDALLKQHSVDEAFEIYLDEGQALRAGLAAMRKASVA
jgi:hypothetical protein